MLRRTAARYRQKAVHFSVDIPQNLVNAILGFAGAVAVAWADDTTSMKRRHTSGSYLFVKDRREFIHLPVHI